MLGRNFQNQGTRTSPARCSFVLRPSIIYSVNFFFFVHRSLIRKSTQTAVSNMTLKRMLKKKLFNLMFRMFRHTTSEVTV